MSQPQVSRCGCTPHTPLTHPHTMGFNTEWVSIMKGVVPQAFTAKPTAPNIRGAFIDGQIQLMKPQFITTMDLFYRVQYANMINRWCTHTHMHTLPPHPWTTLTPPSCRYFKDGPDDMVVVLAFDDYNSVPAAKSMTQSRRKQRVVDVLPFTEDDPLPMDRCPERWDSAMCNRVFKVKLIRKIIDVLGSLITIRGRQRLIIDFIGDPVEYSTRPGGESTCGRDSPCFSRHITGFPPVGEADCKFPRCRLPSAWHQREEHGACLGLQDEPHIATPGTTLLEDKAAPPPVGG